MCLWSATRGFYATPAPVKWATNTMKKFLEGTLRSRLKAAWRQRLRNATQTQSVSREKNILQVWLRTDSSQQKRWPLVSSDISGLASKRRPPLPSRP